MKALKFFSRGERKPAIPEWVDGADERKQAWLAVRNPELAWRKERTRAAILVSTILSFCALAALGGLFGFFSLFVGGDEPAEVVFAPRLRAEATAAAYEYVASREVFSTGEIVSWSSASANAYAEGGESHLFLITANASGEETVEGFVVDASEADEFTPKFQPPTAYRLEVLISSTPGSQPVIASEAEPVLVETLQPTCPLDAMRSPHLDDPRLFLASQSSTTSIHEDVGRFLSAFFLNDQVALTELAGRGASRDTGWPAGETQGWIGKKRVGGIRRVAPAEVLCLGDSTGEHAGSAYLVVSTTIIDDPDSEICSPSLSEVPAGCGQPDFLAGSPQQAVLLIRVGKDAVRTIYAGTRYPPRVFAPPVLVPQIPQEG